MNFLLIIINFHEIIEYIHIIKKNEHNRYVLPNIVSQSLLNVILLTLA